MIQWIETHRFFTVVIVMMLIWGSLFFLFWQKADELTNHPCSLCAEKTNQSSISCFFEGSNIEYYPNGSITQKDGITGEKYIVNE